MVTKPYLPPSRSNRQHTPEQFARAFWSRVVVGAPDACWAWTGTTNGDGRGRVHLYFEGGCRGGKRGKRVRAYAYAVAWELTNGPIPKGLCACHKCDNPNCVNPAHIFLGSQLENIYDMVTKGRHDPYGRQRAASLGVSPNRRRGETIADAAAAA